MGWKRLTRRDLLALILVAGLIVGIGIHRIPPGICVADAGDLQLSATVLGIPHPPGYAAYVSLSYLVTLIPGVDPAHAVSVLCLVVGILALLLAALISIRLGAHPLIAAAASLALTAHPRVWQNITTPEVYIFSIAFSLGAAYALIRYHSLGRSRDLLIAAFLLGVAIVNRPPIVMVAPFFVWAWWKSPWRPRADGRWIARSFASILFAASAPSVYSFAYFYLRDSPATPYNYLDQHNDESRELPESTDGVAAKVRRVIWLATAEQFRDHVGNSWPRVRTKLRWLRYEVVGRELPAGAAMWLLAGVGGWRVLRRAPLTGWPVVAIGLQAMVYVLIYKDFGQAADVLPLLLCLGTFAAVGLSEVVPANGRSLTDYLALTVLATTAIYTQRDAPHRPSYTKNVDATGFLDQIDFDSFPRDAVILTYWTHAPPLLFERIVHSDRRDIAIVVAQEVNWSKMADRYAARPVFATTRSPGIENRHLTRHGTFFRLGVEIQPKPGP